MPPKLPKLPKPSLPPNPIRSLKKLIHDGIDQIHKAENDIHSLTQELKGEETDESAGLERRRRDLVSTSPEPAPRPLSGTSTIEGAVSEETTFKYQLERIIDDLQHLETEHLPAKGRIAGLPCDCIAKAGRDLRRHSLETIPIASRQGKDASLFSEIAPLANHLVEIGTSTAVKSGRYDDEYLTLAGVVSSYRKKIEKVLAECEHCDEAQDLATFIRQRRQGRQSTEA